MAFGLFSKKKKEGNSRYQTLRIKEVINIAQDAVNLVFEKPKDTFDYKPGQFITIIDKVNGQKVRRAYSLYSTPYLDEDPAVTVKRVENGLMSNHINDTYRSGMEIEIMEPMGTFTTEVNPKKKRKAIMFAGGSGITPLYAHLRTLLSEEPNAEITMVYGNRTEAHIIFKDDLDALSKEYSGRLSVIHLLDEDTSGLARFAGIPDQKTFINILESLDLDGSEEYFVCGPQPMMDLVTEVLGSHGIKDDSIRIESFDASKAGLIDADEKEEAGESEVTILLDGEEYTFPVSKKERILANGLKRDIDMPYSCQSGLCTACRGKVLEGEVNTSEAEGLTQEELDQGYALMCVGKPVSDKIKVEIG